METTVRICGVDYTKCERVQDGEHYGIKTLDRTFWLFPVCDGEGREVKSIHPYLPVEIRAVTTQTPDLTQQYPETINRHFQNRQDYFVRTPTLEKYLRDNPNLTELPTQEQFHVAREKILKMSAQDFARTREARDLVWFDQATPEVAEKHGYIGDLWLPEISPDGTTRRVQSMGLATSLHLAIMINRGWSLQSRNAWANTEAIIEKLKYQMIYDVDGKQQVIYLEGMVASAHPPQVAQAASPKELDQKTGNLTLLSPEYKELLDFKKKAEPIFQKNIKHQKLWHQKGGKATSKWFGNEKEAAELARVMRQARDNYIRDRKTKRGALAWAYLRGRAWWKSNNGMKGTPLENFLEEKRVSDSNLYRLMQRDFRHGRKIKS